MYLSPQSLFRAIVLKQNREIKIDIVHAYNEYNRFKSIVDPGIIYNAGADTPYPSVKCCVEYKEGCF